MITFEDIQAQYQPVIDSVAFQWGGKAHHWGAEAGDFRQEFYMYLLDNEEYLSTKYEEIDNPDQFGRWLGKVLQGEAADYFLDIRAQGGGQDRSTAYWYSVAEVKYLLDKVFDEDAWLNPPQIEGASGGHGDPAVGGNWVATLADVSRAFSKLSIEDQTLLRDFHEHGVRNKDMAEVYEITEATMSYRHGQACKRLLDELGGPKPRHMRPDDKYDPWRGRKAVSNASARAIQGHYYDGEDS